MVFQNPLGKDIYICHKCNKPIYFDYYEQILGISYGKKFYENIFPDNNTYLLYEEIRNCMSYHSYTSAELSARKLLMHISVNCGVPEGKKI